MIMRASRPPPRLALRLRSLSARFRSSTASPAVGSAPLKIKTHVDKTPLEADTNPGFGANVRGLGHNNYLGKILNARVYELARETPLQHAANLSAQLQNRVLLKREDMQPVFSFKIRGAYNKIAQLSREQLAAGIVACSAGNHAQGVALSAVHLGIDAVIIMPTATPAIKVNAVRKLGGNVVLHGSNYDEAAAEAMRRVAQEGRTLIHPFDDPLVIAGQGTIAMEILKQTTGCAQFAARNSPRAIRGAQFAATIWRTQFCAHTSLTPRGHRPRSSGSRSTPFSSAAAAAGCSPASPRT